MAGAQPHYITVGSGQLRLWQVGDGPDLVVLAGPGLGAAPLAGRIHAALAGWRVSVLEMPGIGGSASLQFETLEEVAAALAAGIAALGHGDYALAALDMCAAVLPALLAPLPARPAMVLGIGVERARGWAGRELAPPPLEARQDGTHLTALWHFMRDGHLLAPDDPSQPAVEGEPLPTEAELDAGFVAAAVAPRRYAALWRLLAGAMPSAAGFTEVALVADLAGALADVRLAASGVAVPPTAPLAGDALWFDYVQTPRGRVHVRRAGSGGVPVLVLPTGGGSSQQFAPVVQRLARGRQALSIDYFGNGLSDRLDRDVTTDMLAQDAAAVIEVLGFAQVDVWGSHTGALVGLELAVTRPELVRRCVLEGPVFISPDFQTDLLDNYFPAIRPDKWGRHIQLAWHWRRDMFMYWPWYKVDRAAARQLGVPSAEQLHLYAVGILESGWTYDQAYRSAFRYDTARRLPLLERPALICAGPNDMLVNGVAESEALGVAGVRTMLTPTTVWWPDPDADLAEQTYRVYEAYFAG